MYPDESTKERNPGQSSWRYRRRTMFAVLAFCKLVIAYVLWRNLNSGPADTAVTMAFVCIISIVGAYVFGAAWEDISTMRVKGMSAAQTPQRAMPPARGNGASVKVEDQP